MKKYLQRLFGYSDIDKEFIEIVKDILKNKSVLSMSDYHHHGDISCLEHSLMVSYRSFQACKKLGLDYKSAARGGLLHDFFLYDWRVRGERKRFHGLHHPKTALQNAGKHFELNNKERDIIKKHMWPLTLRPPRHPESAIVLIIDKYCATLELVYIHNEKRVDDFRRIFEY